MIGSPTPGKLRERTGLTLSKPDVRLGVFECTCGITPAGRQVVKPRSAPDAGQGERHVEQRPRG